MGCDNAFGTVYVWSKAYDTKIARYKDFVLRSHGKNSQRLTLPLGKGDLKEVLAVMMQDAEERGNKVMITGLTDPSKKLLEETMPGFFEYTADRNSADYIYASSDLEQLAGKKYHGKRNHISKFKSIYNWSYENITADNLDECIALAKKWCVANGCSKENGLDKEFCALRVSFDHFFDLDFLGGLLRVDGKAVAFTIGEEINQTTFDVHFEKALSDYNGAYTMINREFVANALSQYQYINREEDMGLEGLRKAKLSYHPAILLEKYTAVPKG